MRILLVLSLTLSAFVAAHLAGYRLNITNSEPIGLYRVTNEAPKRGDLATFCLAADNSYSKISSDRNYLGFSMLCPSGQKPLLKGVAGVSGDLVTIHYKIIQVNRTLYVVDNTRATDRNGLPLMSLLSSGVIPEGKALLLSTHHKDSFDSRYFGLVDASTLRKVTPVYTFNQLEADNAH